MDLGLKDKRIVVTGAMGGIGTEICKVLEEEGARVVPVDIKSGTDLGDAVQTHEYFQELREQYKKIDGFVSSVYGGPGGQSGLHEVRLDDFESDMRNTFYAVFYPVKEALTWMRETGGGHIVVITSINAHLGLGEWGYDIAKAGLEQMVRNLATWHSNEGIYSFALAPGTVAPTPAWEGKGDVLAAIARSIPDGKVTHPSEVANFVAFLLSSYARMAIGNTILGDRAWSYKKDFIL